MKPRLAVWKFSSCDGCQLTLLDCEDELLDIAEAVEIAYFLEATRTTRAGPYDVSLVEGSISTADEMERIQQIRRDSRILITIGACATAGGIQALRNSRDHDALRASVYPSPQFIEALATSTPIADHVTVDFELRGCPIDKGQLLEAITALLKGRKPAIPDYSQCTECKLAGTACVMVTKGIPCLGPVTQGGCGNLCPQVGRGCYGCFGPKENANTGALVAEMAALGADRRTIRDLFGGFTASAPAFAAERERHDG
ncbi:oxidoreductase [Pelagibius sp.]|uniref:NADH-quinone oxidoreductase subunit B family protein n=1 Tax=Pelagibius sp. TaxID=1931238 RepID=UPI0026320A49|nr:oxidoreductase [Pelagibius sp.]